MDCRRVGPPLIGPAPRPLLWKLRKTRGNGIRENVGDCSLQVILGVDHPGGEALGEEMAAPAVAGVVLPGVVALEPLECARELLGPRIDDGVVVGSHQAVRMKPQVEASRDRPEKENEEAAVGIGAEEVDLLHRARGDVEIAIRKLGAEQSRHACHGRPACGLSPARAHLRSTSGTAPRAATSVRHWSRPEGASPRGGRRGGRRSSDAGCGRGPAGRRPRFRIPAAGPGTTARAPRPPRPRAAPPVPAAARCR